MRLLESNTPSADKSAGVNQKSTTPHGKSGAGTQGNSNNKADTKKKETPAAPAQAAPAPAVVDYTRPDSTAGLLMELQQRVIKLEEQATRKLTAGEYAIVVEATTGVSLEKYEKSGYVLSKCNCESPVCKGWRLTPIEHHRTAAETKPKNTDPISPSELKDLQRTAILDEDWDDDDLSAIFKQMFKQGLLAIKGDTTLIPPDGPAQWTHAQMLAFAYGFEMTDLLTLRGKPRELQRQLIERLRSIGYDVRLQVTEDALAAPATTKAKRKGV